MTAETELEYRLIGSVLLLGEDCRRQIFSVIRNDFFADPDAGAIYAKLRTLCEKYPQADETVLITGLSKQEQTLAVSAMNSMMSPKIAEDRLDDTLKAVCELSLNRQLHKELTELSLSENVSLSDLHQLTQEAERRESNRFFRSADSREKYLASYDEPVSYLPTGFEQLDHLLEGGFRKGTLCTIGARPSTGKTTFAINLASHNPDRKILFVSIEMTAGMIYDRLSADTAGVNYSVASSHGLQKETVRAVLNQFPDLTVADDVSGVEEIVTMIYAQKPDMVMIDFVQIITSRKRFADNRQRIDDISQQLKQAAKQTGCCIITLSQITRNGKDKPTMSDLKESGGLEQDSDYVLILHRPYVNDKSAEDADPSKTTVTLDKNKFGNTAELSYSFNGIYQRFLENRQEGEEIARPRRKEVTVTDDLPF